jgi:hypothetical protein
MALVKATQREMLARLVRVFAGEAWWRAKQGQSVGVTPNQARVDP